MKIGIITFHFPYNCGAVLQCAALQKVLEKEKHNVYVINYRPWYHQNRYTPFKNPIYYGMKCMRRKYDKDPIIKRIARGVVGAMRTIHSWVDYKKVQESDIKFESFIRCHIHQTKVIRTQKGLKYRHPKCNLYISGSDQLWNAKLTENKLDPAYLLTFAEESAGKITYSIGVDFSSLIYDAEKAKKAILNFDAISVREKNGLTTLQKICGDKIPLYITLDPTFLLQKEEYDQLSSTECLEENDYILTYVMPNESQFKVYNAAKQLAKKTGLKIIDINGSPNKNNKMIEDHRVCGPDEFLWYIKNSRYVITNSFHGTAFSIIFNKQFAVIPHSETGYRVTDLLDKIGLSDRYFKDGITAYTHIEDEINYKHTMELVDVLRRDSIDYLRKYICNYGERR